VRSLTYGYNANSQMTSADDDGAKGRDYDWFYDKMGRVDEIRWDGLDYLTGYQYQLQNDYDANSRRYQRTLHIDVIDPYSDFNTLTDYWWLDNLGRPYQQQQWDNAGVYINRLATYSYNAAGQLTAMDRYNYTTGWNLLVNTTWNYDGAGQIKELKHFKADRSTLLAGYTYGWDAAGRMTAMDFSSHVRNNDAEDVSTFGYDRSGQLLTGDRTGTTNDEAYAYDASGNRTSANGATYTTPRTTVSPTTARSPTPTTTKGTR
jgi:YD repeat-containing protein